jgi:uncharacterized protein (TIGR00251 family)
MTSDFIRKTMTGLRLTVKAKAGSRQERSSCIVDIGEGQTALELRVKEAAVDGRANEALARKIAELFEVRLKDVTLRSGAKSKIKVFDICGNPDNLFILAQKIADEASQ